MTSNDWYAIKPNQTKLNQFYLYPFNGYKYCYATMTIQFDIIHLFAHS